MVHLKISSSPSMNTNVDAFEEISEICGIFIICFILGN